MSFLIKDILSEGGLSIIASGILSPKIIHSTLISFHFLKNKENVYHRNHENKINQKILFNHNKNEDIQKHV